MTKTAIILFANLPEAEARAKSFSNCSSQKTTRQISQVLTQHFYHLAQQSSADAFLIDSSIQKGKNFAERITNAFYDTYAKGYENVICIGNDCPSLTLKQLEIAVEQVQKNKVVLGPTKDGGAYLISLPISCFKVEAFTQIKWQSSKAYQGLKSLFQGINADVLETETLSDFDRPEDILNAGNQNNITKLLAQLILDFADTFRQKFFPINIDYIKVDSFSLKGPPAFSV